jgi:predicted membrane channel-forming protein YqfA (hemolysin III family)
LAVRTQILSQRRRHNHRASFAFICGLIAAGIIPVAVEATRKVPGAALLDAVWAIPIAAAAAAASLLFARGARGEIARTLEQAGGALRLRIGGVLAAVGVCLTLSASIAVGLYELLLRLEH